MRLNFYLHFLGQTEEAISFYQSVLGGKITAMMKVAGSPAEQHYPPEAKNGVLHACLELDDMMIMATDSPPQMYQPMAGASICVNLEDMAEAKRLFEALSVGGKTTMPFGETFFAKGFASFFDRYGTQWMILCG